MKQTLNEYGPQIVVLILIFLTIGGSTGQWVELSETIRNIALAATAIGGVYFGARALNAWQSELRGRDRYLVAKEIGIKGIRVVNMIKKVRNRYYWQPEYDEKYEHLKETMSSPIFSPDSEYFRLLTRINFARKEIDKLEELQGESDLMNFKIETEVEELGEILSDIAINAFAAYAPTIKKDGVEEISEERKKEWKESLYEDTGYDDRLKLIEDRLKKRVKAIIHQDK